MRTIVISFAAALLATSPALAQSAGAMGADAAGTGATTLGADADPSELHENMNAPAAKSGLWEGRAAAPDSAGRSGDPD